MAPNGLEQDYFSEQYPTRLWSHISDSGWLEEMGSRLKLQKGQILAKAGEVPEYCYYVVSGRIMSYEYTLSGRERIYNFNQEGSMLLEANLLVRKAPPVSFVALTQVTVIRIARDDLIKRIYVEPEIALDIIASLSYKFLASMDQVRETTHHNVSWKVCNLLLSFADRYGVEYDGKLLINEKISQQMLANLLGVNRITLVRIIKELRDLGLIEQVNGFYCIRDVGQLKEYMGQEAAAGSDKRPAPRAAAPPPNAR